MLDNNQEIAEGDENIITSSKEKDLEKILNLIDDNINSINLEYKKLPYNGKAKNLLDKFIIIGYDKATLTKLLLNPKLNLKSPENPQKKQSFQEIAIKERPSVLSEVCNDPEKSCLPDEDVINLTFIENETKIYYMESTQFNKLLENKIIKNGEENFTGKSDDWTNIWINEPLNQAEKALNSLSYNVVFSSDSIKMNLTEKNSFNCFSHVFYTKFPEEKEENNLKFYFFIPHAFCIISEYPNYSTFLKLSQQIKTLFLSEKVIIPIEILLQNIVSFIPFPYDLYVRLIIYNLDKKINKSLINENSSSTINKLNSSEFKEGDLLKYFSVKDPNIITAEDQKRSLISFSKDSVLNKESTKSPE